MGDRPESNGTEDADAGSERAERTHEGADDENPDAHPYGEDWPDLRDRVWRRDGHACRRCGADDRTIQAHHIVPRSAGGPDVPENLLTLCRPCHGVVHPTNDSFDDVRDEASLFPDKDAPEPVALMKSPEDRVCDRCGRERDDPTELLAWRDPPTGSADRPTDHLILCKPCAGLVLDRNPDSHREDLEGNHRFSVGEVSAMVDEASVRPSVWAPEPVAVRREPRTRRERVVDDTPLRFVLNSRAATWAVLLVVGYLLLMVGVSAL